GLCQIGEFLIIIAHRFRVECKQNVGLARRFLRVFRLLPCFAFLPKTKNSGRCSQQPLTAALLALLFLLRALARGNACFQKLSANLWQFLARTENLLRSGQLCTPIQEVLLFAAFLPFAPGVEQTLLEPTFLSVFVHPLAKPAPAANQRFVCQLSLGRFGTVISIGCH